LPEEDEKLPPPHLTRIAEVPAQSANVFEAPAHHFYPTDVVEATSQPVASRNIAEAPTQLGHPMHIPEMPTEPSNSTTLEESLTEVAQAGRQPRETTQPTPIPQESIPAAAPTEAPSSDTEVGDLRTSDQVVTQPEQTAVRESSTSSELEDKIDRLKKEQAKLEERRKRLTELQKLDEQEEVLAKQLTELERQASARAPG
jgi:hypothetical protein